MICQVNLRRKIYGKEHCMQEHDYKPGYFLPYELSDAGSGGPTVRETLVKG